MAFTPEQKNKYFADQSRCPFCDCNNLVRLDDCLVDGVRAWQAIECKDCQKSWQDVYNLVDMDEDED